jgi:hypothetical protein
MKNKKKGMDLLFQFQPKGTKSIREGRKIKGRG